MIGMTEYYIVLVVEGVETVENPQFGVRTFAKNPDDKRDLAMFECVLRIHNDTVKTVENLQIV